MSSAELKSAVLTVRDYVSFMRMGFAVALLASCNLT